MKQCRQWFQSTGVGGSPLRWLCRDRRASSEAGGRARPRSPDRVRQTARRRKGAADRAPAPAPARPACACRRKVRPERALRYRQAAPGKACTRPSLGSGPLRDGYACSLGSAMFSSTVSEPSSAPFWNSTPTFFSASTVAGSSWSPIAASKSRTDPAAGLIRPTIAFKERGLPAPRHAEDYPDLPGGHRRRYSLKIIQSAAP